MTSVLNALVEKAIASATVGVAEIAELEGYNRITIGGARYRWLLPAYGKSHKKTNRCWTLLEYWTWRSIDAETRKQSINARAPVPKEEILRQWEIKLSETSAKTLVNEINGDDARAKLLGIQTLFRTLGEEVLAL